MKVPVDNFKVEGLLTNPNRVGSLQLPISRSAPLPSIEREQVLEGEGWFCVRTVIAEETTQVDPSDLTVLLVEDTSVEDDVKVEVHEAANLPV